ncbi:hypothetical protein C8F01DRAFT_1267676 [Mycena amicta]|nr:hypothetical protein C8F01DRAFT_1267676 [Mycena amicta]
MDDLGLEAPDTLLEAIERTEKALRGASAHLPAALVPQLKSQPWKTTSTSSFSSKRWMSIPGYPLATPSQPLTFPGDLFRWHFANSTPANNVTLSNDAGCRAAMDDEGSNEEATTTSFPRASNIIAPTLHLGTRRRRSPFALAKTLHPVYRILPGPLPRLRDDGATTPGRGSMDTAARKTRPVIGSLLPTIDRQALHCLLPPIDLSSDRLCPLNAQHNAVPSLDVSPSPILDIRTNFRASSSGLWIFVFRERVGKRHVTNPAGLEDAECDVEEHLPSFVEILLPYIPAVILARQCLTIFRYAPPYSHICPSWSCGQRYPSLTGIFPRRCCSATINAHLHLPPSVYPPVLTPETQPYVGLPPPIVYPSDGYRLSSNAVATTAVPSLHQRPGLQQRLGTSVALF